MLRTGPTGIPDGWRIVRLDDVAAINPKRPRLQVDSQELILFVPMANVAEGCRGIVEPVFRRFDRVARGYTYFEESDVLFAKIIPCLQNGKHVIASTVKHGFGFASTEFHVLRAGPDLHAKHLFRILTCLGSIKRLEKSIAGTAGQQRIRPESLRSMVVQLPPLSEQRAIAAVLDSIDEAIERADEVIAVTERLRDALLHELLTRGLPGQHSEWKEVPGLGTIPASWKAIRLGDVVDINRDSWVPEDEEEIIHYLDLTAVFAPGSVAEPREIVSTEAPSRARRRVHSGDVLVSTVRPNLRGFVRITSARDNLIASTGFAVLSPRQSTISSYIYHHVMTPCFAAYLENRDNWASLSSGSTGRRCSVQAQPSAPP